MYKIIKTLFECFKWICLDFREWIGSEGFCKSLTKMHFCDQIELWYQNCIFTDSFVVVKYFWCQLNSHQPSDQIEKKIHFWIWKYLSCSKLYFIRFICSAICWLQLITNYDLSRSIHPIIINGLIGQAPTCRGVFNYFQSWWKNKQRATTQHPSFSLFHGPFNVLRMGHTSFGW